VTYADNHFKAMLAVERMCRKSNQAAEILDNEAFLAMLTMPFEHLPRMADLASQLMKYRTTVRQHISSTDVWSEFIARLHDTHRQIRKILDRLQPQLLVLDIQAQFEQLPGAPLTDEPSRELLHQEYVRRRRIGPRVSAPVDELWFLFNDQIIRAKPMSPNGPLKWKESARLSVNTQVFNISENVSTELTNAIAINIPGRSEELCCELPSADSKARWLQLLQDCTGQKPKRRSCFFSAVEILEFGSGKLPTYRPASRTGNSPTVSDKPRRKDRGSYDSSMTAASQRMARPLSG